MEHPKRMRSLRQRSGGSKLDLLSCRLNSETLRQIDEGAWRLGVSRSAYVHMVLLKWIAHQRIPRLHARRSGGRDL